MEKKFNKKNPPQIEADFFYSFQSPSPQERDLG
jgi:hypothetical protein